MAPRRPMRSGPLALIGGRFESDNAELFAELKAYSGGRIAALAMASGFPEEVGQDLVEDFCRYGFEAELIPLFWENRATAAFDPELVERLASYGSVFFSGGDQSRIVETLIQDGQETPVLRCIRACHAEGGLIAGTSAGAAIMSGPMIENGTSLNALGAGVCTDPEEEDGFRLGTGLGFFPWGIVDQHFLHRGRIGRLLAAARALQQQFAFGVDENTALLVEGSRARVCGETGVLFLDLREAKYDRGGYDISDVRVSYLDDGDGIDLAGGRPLAAADKKRVRVTRASFRRPAPLRRNAFASYALLDLMLRLVEGDPAIYRHDSAFAYDEQNQRQFCVEVERKPRRARALRAVREAGISYSAIDFDLRVRSCAMGPEERARTTSAVLPPDPLPGARLVLLGSSPRTWSSAHLAELRRELREPIGLFPMASGAPTKTVREYLSWFCDLGLRAELFDISLFNIERAGRDRGLLNRIGQMGSLLFTGGNQRRLTETLLHCADATPVLHAVISAYERGIPLIGVAAAASAFGTRAIVEGESVDALRYGASEDAGFAGVVIEAGIGLAPFGLIDQHFLQRHRLGRLLVACVAERSPYGFGLCEESGLVMIGGERRLQAIGRMGVVVATLDLERVRFNPPEFSPDGIRLNFVEPGGSFHLDSRAVDAVDCGGTGRALLDRAIEDFSREHDVARGRSRSALERLRYSLTGAPAFN